MIDRVILTYGGTPTRKKFSRVLHVKGIDGPDSVMLVNPLLNVSDDGQHYEYAEGYKRRITVNLGVVQERADQLWLWNFFWAQNSKKISFCGENPTNAATPDYSTVALQVSANPYSNGDRLTLDTSGTLPSGLSDSIAYYVVGSSGDYFSLSLTAGGAAVNFTDNGSGILTVTEVAEADLEVTMENFTEFILNWADNIKTQKDIILSLIEKNVRTTNPSSWS